MAFILFIMHLRKKPLQLPWQLCPWRKRTWACATGTTGAPPQPPARLRTAALCMRRRWLTCVATVANGICRSTPMTHSHAHSKTKRIGHLGVQVYWVHAPQESGRPPVLSRWFHIRPNSNSRSERSCNLIVVIRVSVATEVLDSISHANEYFEI